MRVKAQKINVQAKEVLQSMTRGETFADKVNDCFDQVTSIHKAQTKLFDFVGEVTRKLEKDRDFGEYMRISSDFLQLEKSTDQYYENLYLRLEEIYWMRDFVYELPPRVRLPKELQEQIRSAKTLEELKVAHNKIFEHEIYRPQCKRFMLALGLSVFIAVLLVILLMRTGVIPLGGFF